MRALALAVAALLPIVGACGGGAGQEISGNARVIDGDSLAIGDTEMRLHGIDAPEGHQTCEVDGRTWRCGQAAAETLSMLVANRAISCRWRERDDYGRALATCYRDDMNINAMMVEVGMALAYRRYSSRYAAQEDTARSTRRGLWDAAFEAPWDWRRRQAAQQAHDDDCAVKGNVNRNGNRIYHLRGWRDYARVRLRPDEGDRCFGSESEARAAGFRPGPRD